MSIPCGILAHTLRHPAWMSIPCGMRIPCGSLAHTLRHPAWMSIPCGSLAHTLRHPAWMSIPRGSLAHTLPHPAWMSIPCGFLSHTPRPPHIWPSDAGVETTYSEIEYIPANRQDMQSLSARQHRENARIARLGKANVTFESLIDVSEDTPDPLSHLPPVQLSTLYLYENAMKSWLEFHSSAQIEDPLLLGQLPDFDQIKSWLRWLVYTSQGREHEHVFRSTLENYWSRLRVAFYRQEGQKFSEALCAQVNSV